jgi:hypothetical protein
MMLQRLLWTAEASFSLGTRDVREAAMMRVTQAFEYFRDRYQEEASEILSSSEGEDRRTALLAMARLLREMDRSIAQGDPHSMELALAGARKVLAASHEFNDSSHSSGVRRRDSGEPDE